MSSKRIHIVSFDVPYPPDYGGAVDVFHKIRALKNMGCEIVLHCFEYGRGKPEILESFCKEVYYYERNTGMSNALSRTPYIIKSRKNQALLNKLQSDNAPVLFEGLHTTAFLNSKELNNRLTGVRTHNIEHDYYRGLAMSETDRVKKTYFQSEATKLKRAERKLSDASVIFSISKTDTDHFLKLNPNTIFIAPFHGHDHVETGTGFGEYILYHGNLSVPENIKACLMLIEHVFNKIDYPVVIAGKNPDKQIIKATSAKNISLVVNPTGREMQNIVKDAHINLLITEQSTGLKLKLIDSLFSSRHCLVNSKMVSGTGIESACVVKDTYREMVDETHNLMKTPFSEKHSAIRKELLSRDFSNHLNAEKIFKAFFTG